MVGKVKIGLETDHRGMNKFASREDRNYQRVLGQIKHLQVTDSAPRNHDQSKLVPEAHFESKYFMVPYPENHCFTPRDVVHEFLDQCIRHTVDKQARIAIKGLGGSG